jgi:hypothetical protein
MRVLDAFGVRRIGRAGVKHMHPRIRRVRIKPREATLKIVARVVVDDEHVLRRHVLRLAHAWGTWLR